MGLFELLFGTTKKSEQNGIVSPVKPDDQLLPEIKESNGLEITAPVAKEDEIKVSMPLDEIYKYLRIDFESRGFDDAMSNPDISYRDMNKHLLVSNLKVLFKQVKQIYIDNLKTNDFHIKSREQAGLIDIVDLLKNRKETLENHLNEIIKMETDLENKEDYMIGMLLSYERGFLRGLAALSMESLKHSR
jgi:hypothetical protein